MKIVFISNSFPPLVDGVGDYTYHLSFQFAERGHKVYIICSKKKEIIDYWQKNTSRIEIIPIIDSWHIGTIPILLAQIKKIKPDWILLQYVPYAFSYYGLPFSLIYLNLLLKFKKFKTLITFHELFIGIELHKLKYLPIAICQRLIAYTLAFLAKKIIVSIDITQKSLSFFSKKVSRVPVPSNIVPYQTSVQELSANKYKIAANNEFVICSFGIRKHDGILDVLAGLIQEGYNVKLVLMGKISELQASEILTKARSLYIEDRLLLTGYLTEKEIFINLKCADLFILLETVNKKGHGGASTKSGSLAAAYAAGLPIISTKGHITDDFFIDHKNILFVKQNNFPILLSSIKSVINNQYLRQELSEGATATYERELNWNKATEKYMKALSS